MQQFAWFQAAQRPLHRLRNEWVVKAHLHTSEQPLHSPDRDRYERMRLLRGLLRIAGLEKAPPPSGGREPEEPEEPGDLCCQSTIDSDSVQARMELPAHQAWLEANAQQLQVQFGCQAPKDVTSLIMVLRSVLKKTVGLDLVTGPKKRVRQRTEEGGDKRRAVSSWQIDPICRDTLLELAYSVASRQMLPDYAAAPEWDVASTVGRMQPAFRWQALTDGYAAARAATASASVCSFHAAEEEAEERVELLYKDRHPVRFDRSERTPVQLHRTHVGSHRSAKGRESRAEAED